VFFSIEDAGFFGMQNGNAAVYSYASPAGWRFGGNSGNNVNIYTQNEWVHVAYVRSGTTIKVYKNGVQVGSATWNSNLNATGNLYQIGWGGNYSWNGYIDEMRWSPGVARWTTTFTPPTAAYGVDPTYIVSDYKVNDTGTADTDLWTAEKIATELDKKGNAPYFNYGPLDKYNDVLQYAWPMEADADGVQYDLIHKCAMIPTYVSDGEVTRVTGKNGYAATTHTTSDPVTGSALDAYTSAMRGYENFCISLWWKPDRNYGISCFEWAGTEIALQISAIIEGHASIQFFGGDTTKVTFDDSYLANVTDGLNFVCIYSEKAAGTDVYKVAWGRHGQTTLAFDTATLSADLGNLDRLILGYGHASPGAFDEVYIWRNLVFDGDYDFEDFANALFNSGTGRFFS
jgi:hypothetical protein